MDAKDRAHYEELIEQYLTAMMEREFVEEGLDGAIRQMARRGASYALSDPEQVCREIDERMEEK